MRAAECLSEDTRVLPPLTVGDSGRIQNQTGPHPTKWDKTGIVVEVRQFDQYVIRVDGSGRTTLHNRKFLRKYVPVIPRTPILMAPGDRPVMCTPPATHTDPTSVNIPLHEPPPLTTTQAPSNTTCRPPPNLQPTTGSASTPLQQPPMTPDHDPSPGPMKRDNFLPSIGTTERDFSGAARKTGFIGVHRDFSRRKRKVGSPFDLKAYTMPDRDNEVFSNPLPPTAHRVSTEETPADDHHLTNEDFRKMLMTPKPSSSTSYTESVKHARKDVPVMEDEGEEDDAATRRKKKKSYYAKLKRDEEERQKELESKYRDRAKERREGSNKDYTNETEMISTTADYRAVAPDAKAIENYAERRKQVIQASKYLGGDMEHTHLVKGLDFALLEKVRAEINSKEKEEEDMMEAVVTQPKEEEDPEEKITFKSKLGRNIYRTLFKNRLPTRNELFLPRRMAYVIDLEDDFAESDVPATLIRSKADCPTLAATTTLSTNDIVINKLTQILSYLRQGKREAKKLKKKEKGKLKEEEKARITAMDDSIYGDLGDYEPSFNKPKEKKERDRKDRDRDRERESDRDRERERDRGRDRERDREHNRDRERDRDRDREREKDRRDRDRDRDRERDKERSDRFREPEERPSKKSYFEKPVEEDQEEPKAKQTAKELVKSINDRFKGYAEAEEEKEQVKAEAQQRRLQKLKAKTYIDSYAECYPGMMESADAIDDSDEEVDFTKMDQGNKKGPVGRWDFDTAEEYSDYMSNREALPKAAFQYGVKMSDGRRTRRTAPKDEKQKLDREMQQIQRIIEKRKPSGHSGGSDAKLPKY
ncbi:protein red-like [Plakobranchus ocellatus]|uniref:Protein red-like n=1 Tax=Plakobranchus ocellatus TaxID=259542 RepID=A0AAV3ZRJ8_9GAST|nr:protein red-like [Plakobranchus ocellatus]